MASVPAHSGSFFAYARAGELIAAGSVFPALGIVAVGLRFYARRITKARIGVDDYLILSALVVLCGMGSTLIVGAAGHGLGYSTPLPPDPSPEAIMSQKLPQITLTMKCQYAFQLMMIVSVGLIKLSVLTFCRRLFVVEKKSVLNYVCIGTIVIVILWTLGFLLAFAFNCKLKAWAIWGSLTDLMTYCDQGFGGEQAIVITDFITDLIVFCIPLPLLFRLHLPWSKKIGAIGVFILAGMAMVASIVRVVIFMIITTRGYDWTEDQDLTVGTTLYWSMIEAGLALIAACLPVLRITLRKLPLDSVVSSARSVYSIISKRSQSSRESQNTTEKYTETEASISPLSSRSKTSSSKEESRVRVDTVIDIEANVAKHPPSHDFITAA